MLKSCSSKSTILILSLLAILSPSSVPAVVAQEAWQNADVGQVGRPGGASISEGVLHIEGSGSGMENSADSFHWVRQKMNKDYAFQALMDPQDGAEAALTVRESEDAASPGLWVGYSNTGTVTVGFRGSKANEVNKTTFNVAGTDPFYLRLTRTGDKVELFSSEDGESWDSFYQTTVSFPENTLAGYAIAGDNVQAAFHGIQMEGQAVEETPDSGSEITANTEDAAGENPSSSGNSGTGTLAGSGTETTDNEVAVAADNPASGSNSSEGPREIFVDAIHGHDAKDGLSATPSETRGPKRTVQSAMTIATEGDSVVIMEGSYDVGDAFTGHGRTIIIRTAGTVTF